MYIQVSYQNINNNISFLFTIVLICVWFNFFFMSISSSQTLLFRPTSFVSFASQQQYLIIISTILINTFFGIAINLKKVIKKIFFFHFVYNFERYYNFFSTYKGKFYRRFYYKYCFIIIHYKGCIYINWFVFYHFWQERLAWDFFLFCSFLYFDDNNKFFHNISRQCQEVKNERWTDWQRLTFSSYLLFCEWTFFVINNFQKIDYFKRFDYDPEDEINEKCKVQYDISLCRKKMYLN